MGKRNTPIDVFKHIDMSGGDGACWPWTKSVGGLSREMREGTKSDSGKARPYFTVGGRRWLVTRLVQSLVSGEEPGRDIVIRHTCDNSICCNPKHFELGSHQDNMNDMVSRDRHGLPSHTVRRIRLLLSRGNMTHKEIGEMFAVSRPVITKIANNQLHTHENDYPTEDDETQ